MASVTAFIRVSKKKIEKANIRFRLSDGRSIQLFHNSKIVVDPTKWDGNTQAIKAKVIFNSDDRVTFNKSIADRKDIILKAYNAVPDKKDLTSEILEIKI